MGSLGEISTGFTFDFSAPLHRTSDSAILEALRRFASTRRADSLGIHDFDRWPDRPCSGQTVSHRFGSWRAALRAAGLDSTHAAGAYTPAELIEKLELAWRTLGRRPGHTTLPRTARVTSFPFKRHWGSLASACRAFEAFHKGRITREQLLCGAPAQPAPRRNSGPPPRSTPRRKIPAATRYAILERARHRCASCARGPHSVPAAELQIDHITPLSKGGKDDESNLRVLCAECNRGKGDRASVSRATGITPAPRRDIRAGAEGGDRCRAEVAGASRGRPVRSGARAGRSTPASLRGGGSSRGG